MSDVGLRTKQKYIMPELSGIEDKIIKKYGEDSARTFFLALRDVYDDLKLLITRQAYLQTPAKTQDQITANQNNYEIPERGIIRMSSDASRNITGFSGGMDGRRLTLINVGSQNIVLKHQDANSDAANRILSQTGADVTVAANGVANLVYDVTTARWRI